MRYKTIFGLACCLAIHSAASAQRVPFQTVQPGLKPAETANYPPSLYQMNGVSKSLNLSQDQITNLNKLTEQTQAQYRDNYNKLGTLDQNDRMARTRDLNRQYYGDWNKGATSIFNDTQMNRYQQLNYQYNGFNSFYDPAVQKQLGLTRDQLKSLNEHSNWSNQQLQEINGIGATDPTKGTQMYQDYWKQHQDRLGNYLTTDQQRNWQKMTGETYGFQPSFAPKR